MFNCSLTVSSTVYRLKILLIEVQLWLNFILGGFGLVVGIMYLISSFYNLKTNLKVSEIENTSIVL